MGNRLRIVGSTNKLIAASDGSYFYYGLGSTQLGRLEFASRMDSTAGALVHDFGVGYKISDIFADPRQAGIVYAVVEYTATEKFSVYSSSDSGSTFIFEKLLGDVDGTTENQLPNVYTLEGGTDITLHDFKRGDGLELFIGEYNGNSGQNCKLLRRSNAGVWSVAWDSQNSVRHIHCVRTDPYDTGLLYVGTGDVNNLMFIMEWDGIIPLPQGVIPENALGIAVLRDDSQSYRTVDIQFDQSYIYWMTDTANNVDKCGIYRAQKNGLSGVTVIDEKIKTLSRGDRYGWTGLSVVSTGDVFISSSGVADPIDDCIFLFGKKDTNSFEIVGRFNQRVTAGGAPGNFRIRQTGSVIWATYSQVAGRFDAFTGFYEIGEPFCEERPDILAPAFYVGAGGVDNTTTNGGTPDFPYLTLNYALNNSHITYGSAVVLLNSVVEDKITAIWDNFAYGAPSRAGQVGQPVQIVDMGNGFTVTQSASDPNTIFCVFSHADQTLEFDGVDVTSLKSGADIFLGTTVNETHKLILRDLVAGTPTGVYVNLVQYRSLEVWAIRSTLHNGTAAILQFDTANPGKFKSIASSFSGANYKLYYRGVGAEVEMYNCAFFGAALYHIEKVDTNAADPIVKNSVFIGSSGYPIKYGAGAGNQGGADYCVFDRAPNGTLGAYCSVNATIETQYAGSVVDRPYGIDVYAMGTEIPENFPLPKYDINKRPLTSKSIGPSEFYNFVGASGTISENVLKLSADYSPSGYDVLANPNNIATIELAAHGLSVDFTGLTLNENNIRVKEAGIYRVHSFTRKPGTTQYVYGSNSGGSSDGIFGSNFG